jgi:hypothetical protein
MGNLLYVNNSSISHTGQRLYETPCVGLVTWQGEILKRRNWNWGNYVNSYFLPRIFFFFFFFFFFFNDIRLISLKKKKKNYKPLASFRLQENIVTYRPITRQRLGKHIPQQANTRDNRMSIDRQQRGKYASSTIETAFSE